MPKESKHDDELRNVVGQLIKEKDQNGKEIEVFLPTDRVATKDEINIASEIGSARKTIIWIEEDIETGKNETVRLIL